MRKKKPIDELLCFFVLLFSFSTIDAEKWKSIVQSFSGDPAIINIPVENKTTLMNLDTASGYNSSIIDDMLEKDEETDLKELLEKLENELEKRDKVTDELSLKGEYGGHLQIIKSEDEIIIRFDNQVLFESGKAILGANAESILIEVLNMVNDFEKGIKEIFIEGNTDNIPINNEVYKDNFELSSARALVVLHHIINNSNFPENKLVAVAYGEYQPIDTNDTDEGRSKNRRTDIVIVRQAEDTKDNEEVNK